MVIMAKIVIIVEIVIVVIVVVTNKVIVEVPTTVLHTAQASQTHLLHSGGVFCLPKLAY